MAGTEVTIEGLPELQALLRKLGTDATETVKRQLAASGLELETEAKKNIGDIPAVDTGKTRASIHYRSANGGMTAEVAASGVVPLVIEFGSAPHFPPIAPLEAWAHRHGMPPGAGFAIAQAIARRGTPAHPFMYPAFDTISVKFVKDLTTKLNALVE